MGDRMDTEALRALEGLRGKITDEDLHESGRYFHDTSFRDLTRCYHGDTGNFSENADGKAIALLWNLWRSGALDRLDRYEAALTRIQRTIVVSECQQIAREAMGKGKDLQPKIGAT